MGSGARNVYPKAGGLRGATSGKVFQGDDDGSDDDDEIEEG